MQQTLNEGKINSIRATAAVSRDKTIPDPEKGDQIRQYKREGEQRQGQPVDQSI
jgi:hypothetical protein